MKVIIIGNKPIYQFTHSLLMTVLVYNYVNCNLQIKLKLYTYCKKKRIKMLQITYFTTTYRYLYLSTTQIIYRYRSPQVYNIIIYDKTEYTNITCFKITTIIAINSIIQIILFIYVLYNWVLIGRYLYVFNNSMIDYTISPINYRLSVKQKPKTLNLLGRNYYQNWNKILNVLHAD